MDITKILNFKMKKPDKIETKKDLVKLIIWATENDYIIWGGNGCDEAKEINHTGPLKNIMYIKIKWLRNHYDLLVKFMKGEEVYYSGLRTPNYYMNRLNKVIRKQCRNIERQQLMREEREKDAVVSNNLGKIKCTQ